MQFIDIILFAMIAVFLVFRLRNTLGKRGGHEGGYRDPFKPKPDDDEAKPDHNGDNVVHLSDRNQPGNDQGEDWEEQWDEPDRQPLNAHAHDPSASADAEPDSLAEGLMQVQMADNSFEAGRFLEGARMAFEMILNSYASGDTATLKNLLSSEVYGNFSKAIKEREQAGEVLEDTLVGIKHSDYLEVYMEGREAFITVKFVTDQVNVTRDENGDLVDGNPNEIITVTDIWTFSRDTRLRNPNWALVATSSLD